MITLFCSKTLQKFLGFASNQIHADALNPVNHWNAHLFYLKGKKAIFFIHQLSYFSFFVYPILKNETKNINHLFISGLIEELKNLSLINSMQEKELIERFTTIYLHNSINNKSTIAVINQRIQDMKVITQHFGIEHIYKRSNNDVPTKKPFQKYDYLIPKEEIIPFLNQLFLN